MDKGRYLLFLACFFAVILICMEAALAKTENEKSNKDKDKNKKAPFDAASTNYNVLTPLPSGQERAFCKARGACNQKTLVCPAECPQRKPKKNKKNKGCFVDCSSKCEVTCKCKPPQLLDHFILFLRKKI